MIVMNFEYLVVILGRPEAKIDVSERKIKAC
jgi:hypothetical protein